MTIYRPVARYHVRKGSSMKDERYSFRRLSEKIDGKRIQIWIEVTGPNKNTRNLSLRYHVDPLTGCYEWDGATHEFGYGIVGTNIHGTFRAHRVAYIIAHGSIPKGKQIDHVCRNPRCVNPKHLEPVSNAQNTRRGDRAKLTWIDVREMRRLYHGGNTTYRRLAQHFGVSSCAVSNIINYKRWKEVPNE